MGKTFVPSPRLFKIKLVTLVCVVDSRNVYYFLCFPSCHFHSVHLNGSAPRAKWTEVKTIFQKWSGGIKPYRTKACVFVLAERESARRCDYRTGELLHSFAVPVCLWDGVFNGYGYGYGLDWFYLVIRGRFSLTTAGRRPDVNLGWVSKRHAVYAQPKDTAGCLLGKWFI